jgi:NADH-quinone oxidoreductase subunit N
MGGVTEGHGAHPDIAHIGFDSGRRPDRLYLVAYAIMTLGAFGVATVLSHPGRDRDADLIEDYRGLLWSKPALAAIFASTLLSLAGNLAAQAGGAPTAAEIGSQSGRNS